MSDNGGLRYDAGKNRLDLIPPEWPEELGWILTIGAKKYAERNWERGMPKSKMLGCALRHIFARVRGEMLDAESGRPHLGHAAWNLLAWMVYDMRGIGIDDLPSSVYKPVGISFDVVSRDPGATSSSSGTSPSGSKQA